MLKITLIDQIIPLLSPNIILLKKHHLKKMSLLSLDYGGHISFYSAYSKNWITEVISKYINLVLTYPKQILLTAYLLLSLLINI